MFWLGFVLSVVGGLWIVVNAFRNAGALWGIGSLLVPFVGLIYGLLNFADNKVPLIAEPRNIRSVRPVTCAPCSTTTGRPG